MPMTHIYMRCDNENAITNVIMRKENCLKENTLSNDVLRGKLENFYNIHIFLKLWILYNI